MACSELFGLNGGEEYVYIRLFFLLMTRYLPVLRFRWGVGHYLFKRKD